METFFRQFVLFNNTKSSVKNINCGIPQGSILGPLLFLIYVNDIATVSPKLFFLIFADDTNVFIDGKDIVTVLKCLNEQLAKLIQWLYANKLSLNISKTHFIIFTLKKCVNCENKVFMNNEIIKQVKFTKFLGVVIDERLSWCEHISYIKSKISKGIGILCKARKMLNSSTLITLYHSFIYPYLTYCVEIWGSSSKKYTDSLYKLQKKLLEYLFQQIIMHPHNLFLNI